MTNSFKPAGRRRHKLYMSVGAIRGQYQPSEDVFTKGVLLTEDGTLFPAIVQSDLVQLLQQQPELLNTPQIFGVWPCTSPESPELFLKLKGLRKEDSQQPGKLSADVDQFSIYGVVVSQDQASGQLVIQIKRNGQTPLGLEQDPAWQPFTLEISGKLPDNAVGQFWKLECCRHGGQLVLKEAHLFVSPPREPKKLIASETIAQPKSPAVAPTPEARITDNLSPADPNADTSPTTGKMEVVVKLNQFPDDVRTQDNGWKEFEVDTGSIIVTITVKPKVFAQLTQAHQAYPLWMAAISGQMGSTTATGFRLNSPSIKVFERKAKGTKPTEQTTSTDNFVPPTEEPQPSPPVPTQTIQQQAQPTPEFQHQPASEYPTQRVNSQLLQLLPTKTPQNQGQKQQRDTVQPGGKQLSPDKACPGKQQSAPSKPHSEPQSDKPRFSVTINGQVFNGFDSVTLNKRVLRVDGKTVGQAKMVVVLGQPRTVQADGGVSQGRNQAVLTSR